MEDEYLLQLSKMRRMYVSEFKELVEGLQEYEVEELRWVNMVGKYRK